MDAPSRAITLLDGGMGRQLSRMGAPFRLPEWSALALIEAPEFVAAAHRAFIAGGAEVITTNSYAVTPDRIGAERFARQGARLAALAGSLARDAARAAAHPVRVAGCLPPLFESYHPETFDARRAPRILEVLVAALAPYVDFWLIETQSSLMESTAAYAGVQHAGLPIWVSYTLRDEIGRRGAPQLRSGEAVADAVRMELNRGSHALLFNCSQPEVMLDAVTVAIETIAQDPQVAAGSRRPPRVGVYANIFAPEPASVEPYAGISIIRDDVNPSRYLEFARLWADAGASIIGGCCGVGPDHIAALRDYFQLSAGARR